MERTKPPVSRLSETFSSQTLFTFTTEIDYLIAMLEFGIRPRYIYERIPILNKKWYYIVAAKCFCDIPLGKIKSHVDWFGNYGLGIDKGYLREQGVSPLMYMHTKSTWIVDSLKMGGLQELKTYPTLPFLKRQFGQDYRRDEDGNYKMTFRKFYDEREWRYIPKNNDLITGDGFKDIKEGLEFVRTKNLKTPYVDSSISISPKEIEYIIIKKFSEFGELKTKLRNLYINDNDYELMLSKILIAERILRDF